MADDIKRVTRSALGADNQKVGRAATPEMSKRGPVALGQNQEIVRDIADCLRIPPAEITTSYVKACTRAAGYLENPTRSAAQGIISLIPVTYSSAPVRNGSLTFIEDVDQRNVALSARNNVFTAMNEIGDFIARAKNSGFAPPSNPFLVMSALNKSRFVGSPPELSEEICKGLVSDAGAFVDLLRAEREGKLNLETGLFKAAQISSCTLSLDGFGGSGHTAVDLMKFLPDVDSIKEQKAQEVLAALDFRKRVPKILFTANYDADGKFKGSIVGWRRIADASGYVVQRRDVFGDSEKKFTLKNSELKARWEQLRDYVRTWVLTFYDSVDPETIFAYLDDDVQPNKEYLYWVQAYQLRNQDKNFIFNIETVPFTPSVVQRTQIREELTKLAKQALGSSFGADDVSPYPIISRKIFGDERFDWVIAGSNVRAAVNRKEGRSVVHGFSYLGAKISFLLEQMNAGKFLIPKDVNSVVARITESVSTFGVSQTISEILGETGTLLFFESRDLIGPDSHPGRIEAPSVQTSNVLAGIIAAVDPETATLDLRSLSSNLPGILNGTLVVGGLKITSRDKGQVSPTEIDVPDFNKITDIISEEDVQFLKKIGNPDDELVDLTTFEGLSKLVRTLRIFSDFGADRRPPPVSPVLNAASALLSEPLVGGGSVAASKPTAGTSINMFSTPLSLTPVAPSSGSGGSKPPSTTPRGAMGGF